MTYPQEYRQAMARLAALDAEAAAQRAEAQRWYDDRCAAADAAVADAEEAVARADIELVRTERELYQVHAEAERLWINYLHQAGKDAERFGRRLPEAALPRQRPAREPDEYFHEVTVVMQQTVPVRPLTNGTQVLFTVFGVAGGALAFAASEGLRWAAREAGGDFEVGLPVLALVVLLLGPLAGFVPTRLVADRRRVPLDTATVIRVVLVALATAALLAVALR